MLSGRGVFPAAAISPERFCHFLPHILVPKPLPGLLYPLGSQDIRAFLASLGPSAAYGLRVIQLRQECLFHEHGITFAEYVIPGEIHLYALPPSPWRLSFVPCPADREAFRRYGATVTVNDAPNQTIVHWEAGGLKSFLLHEVLAHEIGHHILQHNKGKRTAQVCRRADHEAWADMYSHRAGKLRGFSRNAG